MKKLRIATRQSKLALWQANHVKQLLQQHDPALLIELVPVKTTGDRIQDKLLADIGGKGLFIKALEITLLNDAADIAVHSMKDVPPTLPTQFCLPAILPRADARDAFVSECYHRFSDLPKGAIVGTCSPRRQAQLLAHRPDLVIKPLRGNVDTRLKKLRQGEFDAIILAAAGLQRLGLADVVSEYFSIDFMLPSVAQGAIGIECLSTATNIIERLAPLNDTKTQCCIQVERDCVRCLKGNCHSPIGSYAILEHDQLTLQALLHVAQQGLVTHRATVSVDQADKLGADVAEAISKKIYS